MKRQIKSVTRGCNALDFAGITIEHNDDRITYEIPEKKFFITLTSQTKTK
jgi:hypothetical protein